MSTNNLKFIGTSKITVDRKITLLKKVADFLKVEEGDKVAFFIDKAKRVVIKKA